VSDIQRLAELHSTLRKAVELRTYNKLLFFKPYPKQLEFCAAGAIYRERLLMAANQVGKTEIGAFEAALHMTGDYPEWWTGKRFAHPTRGWVAGETGQLTRDGPQKKLCGPPGVVSELGTGFIPKGRIIGSPSLSRSATGAYDMIQVQHRTDGIDDGVSVVTFKSYEQGPSKFQSETLDWGWCDEEPDEEIYAEFLTRFSATDGILFSTFTPLKGRSKVVLRFTEERSPDRAIFGMTIDDAEHMTPEQKEKVIAGYLPHQREARARGIPMQGSGVVYQTPESYVVEPFIEHVPPHWAKIWGIDFGINHPFAAVLLLWDRDNDVIHVHNAIRITGAVPIMHAAAIKKIGAGVPIAWPHDGNNREKGSGEPLAGSYRREGLRMLHSHATFEEGGISVEAGIAEIDAREKTGRWKIASHLSDFLEERRNYHRNDGIVVAERNDLLDASRVGMMMRRYAQAVPLGPSGAVRRGPAVIASGTDFDPLAF
jgi:phage terminase large subunit-like protein